MKYTKIIIIGNTNNIDNLLNIGIKNAILYMNIKCDVEIINGGCVSSICKCSSNTLYFINTKRNNAGIHYDKTNYYLLLNYDEITIPNAIISSNNCKIINEYNSSYDYSNLTKINDYYYRYDNGLVLPWGSLLTPYEILNNLKS